MDYVSASNMVTIFSRLRNLDVNIEIVTQTNSFVKQTTISLLI